MRGRSGTPARDAATGSRRTTGTRWTAMLGILLVPLALGCGEDPVDPPGNGGNGGNGPDPDGHAFTYEPPAGAPGISSITVRGEFNGWAAAGEAVMERQSDGSWLTHVELGDGTHSYKFVINGDWVQDMCYDETWGDPARSYVVDPDADGCEPDGHGGQNAVLVLGPIELAFSHTPDDPADVSVADGRLSIRFRAHGGESATVTADGADHAAHVQFATGLEDVWRASVPATTSSYTIAIETADGPEQFGPYTVPGDLFRSVPWAEDAVAYQIFPERFWNGDETNDHFGPETDEYHYLDVPGTQPVLTEEWDGRVLGSHCCHQYFGGDLQGILDRMGHLEELGVTVLYLNPIFLSGSAHGYDTYDYYRVAPNFGDEALLRTLLDQAHARGMRVIWDFVPNHVGVGHWAFQDAVEQREASEYWDWFDFHPDADGLQVGDPDDYDGWWGFASLPELQTENPEVFDHLLDITRHWTEFGFDGIRVDVPGDIDNRFAFFPAFRDAAKAVNPEVYLLGEIWERDPSWLQGDQFDALMNYAMGRDVVEAYAVGAMSGTTAASRIAEQYGAYPEATTAMMFNLITSHDTARLLTLLGGGELGDAPGAVAQERQRLASALLFALPGMPVTWQGDECAFLGSADGSEHRARYPMQWGECDATMVAHYATLAELKRTEPALGTAVIRLPEGGGSLLSFRRGEPGSGELLAVFNNGTTTRSFQLPAGGWTDVVNGGGVSGSVSVAAFGWRYLRRQ